MLVFSPPLERNSVIPLLYSYSFFIIFNLLSYTQFSTRNLDSLNPYFCFPVTGSISVVLLFVKPAALFAAWSASSFPAIPLCDFTCLNDILCTPASALRLPKTATSLWSVGLRLLIFYIHDKLSLRTPILLPIKPFSSKYTLVDLQPYSNATPSASYEFLFIPAANFFVKIHSFAIRELLKMMLNSKGELQSRLPNLIWRCFGRDFLWIVAIEG